MRLRRVFLLAVCAALAACGNARDEAWRPAPGFPAPDYAAADLGGHEVALADLRGEVVLVNVWATWCVPCLREMPGLEQLHRDYGERGLEVVGVSIDRTSAVPEMREFLEQHSITYQILHDPDNDVSGAFYTIGVPETFLIDREGVIAHRWIGEFQPGAADVAERLAELLAPGSV
jgi:cytochrome c-type biogenesis protein